MQKPSPGVATEESASGIMDTGVGFLNEVRLMMRRILLISNHAIFRESLARLLTDQLPVAVAEATTWEEGLSGLEGESPDAIIIDHEDLQLRDADLAPLLCPGEQSLKVIHLTLAGDGMIVHHRERMENVASADLVRVLGGE
jgi:DNA-binding NarL/FixJ family response regulator